MSDPDDTFRLDEQHGATTRDLLTVNRFEKPDPEESEETQMNSSVTGPWVWVRSGLMWCVTFTRDIGPDNVLTRFGANAHDARLLDLRRAEVLGFHNRGRGPGGSVIRVGALGDWSFSYEENGFMGAEPGPLSALSRGTETFSILKGANATNVFEHWRDGQRTEWFEPGFPSTRPAGPHPWWDAVQGRLDAAGQECPGLTPVMQAVADHTGVVLGDEMVTGPLFGLMLRGSRRTQEPMPPGRPGPATRRGRGRGTLVPEMHLLRQPTASSRC